METCPTPALIGPHQDHNAALASVVLRGLPHFTISPEAMNTGIGSARWPARLQALKHGPLVEAWGRRGAVMLDGGHNLSAAFALQAWMETQATPSTLLLGMMRRKKCGRVPECS